MKSRVKAAPLMAQGMQTFLRRYKDMKSCKFANARLSSALHRFGWVFGGTVRSTQCGHMRRGRRIPVNAQAAGRRRGGSRGKGKVSSGRPVGALAARFPPSRYTLPTRRSAPGKRPHSLKENILQGRQNAGKW